MRINYHPETDSLYIDLSEATSVESREVSEGVVLDWTAARGRVYLRRQHRASPWRSNARVRPFGPNHD